MVLEIIVGEEYSCSVCLKPYKKYDNAFLCEKRCLRLLKEWGNKHEIASI